MLLLSAFNPWTPRMPTFLIALCIALALTSCGTVPRAVSPTPTVSITPAVAATHQPSAAPMATPTLPMDLGADLATTVAAQLAPTPDDGSVDMSIKVVALQRGATEQPLWAVFSTGTTQDAQHFVAIYARTDTNWREQSRITLSNPTTVGPDDTTVVQSGPQDIWLAVQGSSALVGPCCYDLLRFDGTTLHDELSVAERTLDSAVVQPGPNGALEVTISVRPWTGVNGTPAPEEVTVYHWDGQRMVQH